MEKTLTGPLGRSGMRTTVDVLSAGGVAVLPTDTIYGFHCLASSSGGIERISRMKGKGRGRGYILLGSDIEMVDSLVSAWPPGIRDILKEIWPAALTAILPSSAGVPRIISPRSGVAVRIPASKELRSLIRMLAEPLVSTSVNFRGREPMTRIAEIRRAFPQVDLFVSKRGRSGGSPSTLIDFTSRTPRVVRAGCYCWPGPGAPGAPSFGDAGGRN